MKEPSRFPLAWPKHKPRTKPGDRRSGQFSTKVTGNHAMIGLPMACDRVEAEVSRLGGTYPLISTNIEPRLDGRPKGGKAGPDDPGVCVYFQMKGKPYAMACDTYQSVEQNLAGIAAHLEAVRAIERYGVATTAETLQVFTALPPPAPVEVVEDWWEVFGLMRERATEENVNIMYRAQAKSAAGNDRELKRLNLARDRALAELRTQKALA